MKVLLIGNKGMLGQELKVEFGKAHTVFGFDRDNLDITNPTDLQNKINEITPVVVINAAALNAVDKIEESPEFFEKAKAINGDAVGSLARLCSKKNITLVHYSSDYVFKGGDAKGYAEESVVDPLNKYGETKALGEKNLLENAKNFYLIRLSKLFGKPASGGGAKKSFVDTILGLVIDGKKSHLDLVDGEVSCPTYAPDLAKFTRRLIEEKMPYGIYHGSNSGVCSWYELGKKALELKGIKIGVAAVPAIKFPRPAKRPTRSELLNTKMPPQRSWEEALAEYLL